MKDKDKKGQKEKKFYNIRIDKEHFKVEMKEPTARDLLTLAGKTPAEHYALYFKPKKGAPERIDLEDTVDLRKLGVERFVTLPLDQTEGLGMDRREFDLPAEDLDWLKNCGMRFELVQENQTLRVVLYDFPVPEGYNLQTVDVNVRIDSGYPDVQIDMAYFYPPLARTNGQAIGALSPDSLMVNPGSAGAGIELR